MNIDWMMFEALATALGGAALVASFVMVFRQLRQQTKETFISGTATTFAIWMDDDFQRAQQWLLYQLNEQTWRDFVATYRGDYGERASIEVGSYYSRIGYLVSYQLRGPNDRIVLDIVAGRAIAIWRKIEPLVLEARLIENSTLFQDFERMLPRCYQCYVPTQPIPAGIIAAAKEEARLAGKEG